MSSASIQRVINVFDDESGDKVVVKDDEDGLGLIVLMQDESRISLTVEQAALVASALLKLCSSQ